MAEIAIYRTTGAKERRTVPNTNLILTVRKIIGADALDTVNLRDGRVMLVDDMGHPNGLPVNREATRLYHSVCHPGTTHEIRGDAVVAWDQDFASED